MVDEEPIQQRDLVAMGQLHSIGIQKGRPFTPDRATRDVLKRAADEAHLTFMENAMVGDPFRGDRLYRLHVPALVPAKQSWSATIHDAETSCFIRDSPRLGIDSTDPKVQRNADGSVEVFVGPKAPPGRERNWLYTKPGKHWFSFFRFYGPEKPLFEKSWKLMDFEKVQLQ
jgi:hypothetical protein